jgi:hypothetical protein
MMMEKRPAAGSWAKRQRNGDNNGETVDRSVGPTTEASDWVWLTLSRYYHVSLRRSAPAPSCIAQPLKLKGSQLLRNLRPGSQHHAFSLSIAEDEDAASSLRGGQPREPQSPAPPSSFFGRWGSCGKPRPRPYSPLLLPPGDGGGAAERPPSSPAAGGGRQGPAGEGRGGGARSGTTTHGTPTGGGARGVSDWTIWLPYVPLINYHIKRS